VYAFWYFWDRVSWTICPGWLRTEILLISASQIARITGMNHFAWLLSPFFTWASSWSQSDPWTSNTASSSL
jgi:hypothetical protein